MKARIYYLRSAKKNQDGRGDPIACLMSEVDREANAIRYSIAAAHPQDEFSKGVGRKIAAGRLELSPRILTGVNIPTSGHQISRVIMGDIIDQVDMIATLSKKDLEEHFSQKWFYHIPAKVGNAAKRWLKKANEPKTWTAKDLTATTSSFADLTSHVVPLNLSIPMEMGWIVAEGRIGATLSPIASLVVRHGSDKSEHVIGVDLDKGILLGGTPASMTWESMTWEVVQSAVGIMNARRSELRAAQELLKHEIVNPSIPTIEVQTQNILTPPPTIPDLPANKNEPNRTQKPWGDGEYPNGKALGGDVAPKSVEPKKPGLSDKQQANFEYYQTQLPSLLKNTFVKGRFVLVAKGEIQRAFDKFADAYSYAVGTFSTDEFIIQEVVDGHRVFVGTMPSNKLVLKETQGFIKYGDDKESGQPLDDQTIKDLVENGIQDRRNAEAARITANVDRSLRVR